MASLNNNEVRLCSYNMRGFNSGMSMINELCESYRIICVQEHWLRTDELAKFNLLHKDFHFQGVSGMTKSTCSGLLQGRPYGGMGYLWHKSLNNCIQFLSCGCDGRIMSFKLNFAGLLILLFNVYFPYL